MGEGGGGAGDALILKEEWGGGPANTNTYTLFVREAEEEESTVVAPCALTKLNTTRNADQRDQSPLCESFTLDIAVPS